MLSIERRSYKKSFCIKLLIGIVLLTLLASAATASPNKLCFVTGSEAHIQTLNEVLDSRLSGVSVNIYNATEANNTDFSAENVLFLASLDSGTLENINKTLNQSANIVSYNLSEDSDLGNVKDSKMTELWTLGGYHNLKTLLRYMNESFYGSCQVPPEKPEVAFVFSRESAVISMEKLALDPEISSLMNISVYFGRSNEDLSFDLSDKDIVVLRDLGAPVIEKLSPTVNAAKTNGASIITVGDLIQSYSLNTVNLSDPDYADINEYFQYDSEENFRRLVTFLSVKFAGSYEPIEPVVARPLYGIYHPRAPEIYSKAADYLEWYKAQGYDSEKPTVGLICCSLEYITTRDAPLTNALVEAFEAQGCNVVVATYAYKDAGSRDYLMLNGDCIVDSVVVISRGSRLNYKNAEQGVKDLETWNVTAMNGIRLFYSISAEEWENSPHGVGPEQTYQLAFAEMDGIIEPIVIGCKDPLAEDSAYYPIDYQVDWLVNRTVSWMELHRMPNSEKKIVIPYYAAEAGKATVG
ncbi:MAG: cobaltochelatase subunit CobN, partial [Methanosarcinaceae archaeon]|nr:cobaltochelatase subunit CobN [Methanosarcinaceae archaeon]